MSYSVWGIKGSKVISNTFNKITEKGSACFCGFPAEVYMPREKPTLNLPANDPREKIELKL